MERAYNHLLQVKLIAGNLTIPIPAMLPEGARKRMIIPNRQKIGKFKFSHSFRSGSLPFAICHSFQNSENLMLSVFQQDSPRFF